MPIRRPTEFPSMILATMNFQTLKSKLLNPLCLLRTLGPICSAIESGLLPTFLGLGFLQCKKDPQKLRHERGGECPLPS